MDPLLISAPRGGGLGGVSGADASVGVWVRPLGDLGPAHGVLSGVAQQLADEAVAEWVGGVSAPVRRRCDRCGSLEHGRPVVLPDGPYVSITHTAGLVAVAVTGLGPVGVDVERVRDLDVASVAARVIGDLDGPVSDATGFLRAWVRKEAVVKATGDGIQARFSEVGTDSTAGWIAYCGSRIAGRIEELAVPDGFVGALAVLSQTPPHVGLHRA